MGRLMGFELAATLVDPELNQQYSVLLGFSILAIRGNRLISLFFGYFAHSRSLVFCVLWSAPPICRPIGCERRAGTGGSNSLWVTT